MNVTCQHRTTNFTEVTIGSTVYYFSYNTVVAIRKYGSVLRMTNAKQSKTTKRHMCEIVREFPDAIMLTDIEFRNFVVESAK